LIKFIMMVFRVIFILTVEKNSKRLPLQPSTISRKCLLLADAGGNGQLDSKDLSKF